MKKYLKSGFNTTQNIKLEAGTYSLVAYVKSLYGNTYTFALGYDGAQGVEWTEYDVDVVKNQLCKVWFTFTSTEKITKLKPISSNFSASLPVYVADLQLTRGNVPVEAGASPLDVDEILNETLAKTKFMTEIDGGLIYSAMMKLYDAGGTGDEMAGISGIAGENKEDPAFWAGGTYEQAIGGTAKAIIRHNGTAKFTDAEIEGVIVSRNSMGSVIASMNIEDKGEYIQYYPSGNKMMEFNGGVITYYENNEDNTVLWTLGRAGAIISGKIDSWQVITLTATTELGSGIKQPYIDGVEWRVFVPGSPSSWGSYRGLTITNDSFNYDNPSNIPEVSYIPNGWYTNSGSAPMIIDEGYYREIVYYQSGYKTNSTKIITF